MKQINDIKEIKIKCPVCNENIVIKIKEDKIISVKHNQNEDNFININKKIEFG